MGANKHLRMLFLRSLRWINTMYNTVRTRDVSPRNNDSGRLVGRNIHVVEGNLEEKSPWKHLERRVLERIPQLLRTKTKPGEQPRLKEQRSLSIVDKSIDYPIIE